MPTPSKAHAVFIDTAFDGIVPSLRDADGKPCLFGTRREAELEVVDLLQTRLREFIDGSRDYEDAITVEEFVMEVSVLPNGALRDEHGRLRRASHLGAP
jgi:hypothetical protein